MARGRVLILTLLHATFAAASLVLCVVLQFRHLLIMPLLIFDYSAALTTRLLLGRTT